MRERETGVGVDDGCSQKERVMSWNKKMEQDRIQDGTTIHSATQFRGRYRARAQGGLVREDLRSALGHLGDGGILISLGGESGASIPHTLL